MFALADYLWIVWVVFILVCVIIEIFTLEFTFLMIGVGSLGGLAAYLLGAPWWGQILIAAALAILLLATIRPFLLRLTRRGGDPTPSNIAALMALGGRVHSVALGEHGGLVKLANGETWTARLAVPDPSTTLRTGDRIIVAAIEGSTAVVIPAASADARAGEAPPAQTRLTESPPTEPDRTDS